MNRKTWAVVVVAVFLLIAGCLGILGLIGVEKKPPTVPAHSIVDMPDGHPDVIMKCLGPNGVYTNDHGAVTVIQSDALCATPVIEEPG